ncbi:hypothetical protein GW590_10005 [Rahnella sp. SAP-1]|uniref:Uncharacterized protein n=1 Tax=Rouxiella aceris TaxID=2703884 RepID=A0A848MG56_9GAMM|nr:hypothetical protein [Rouxiella aceris]
MADFPVEYRPDDDSYLYEEIATQDALNLRAEQTQSFMLGLDNQLFIDDLSIIPRIFQQLYCFHYGLAHLGMTSVRDVMGKLLGNWTGGASAVNIFTGLKNIIPVIHRPQIASLQFNSPGHIELNLLPNLALSIEQVAARLSSPIRTKRADALYKNTYSYFKDNGLSGFDDERGLEVRDISPETLENIVQRVRIFFKCFGWTDYHSKFNLIDAHPLQQLRAVLAYYRRLKILNQYIIDDKLEIGRSRVVGR